MEKYLMDICRNWGDLKCYDDVSKWRYAKKLKPGEEIPIRPVGLKQRKLDEICMNCESREFNIQERECPACGGTTLKQVDVYDFSNEIEPKEEILSIKCKDCDTPLRLISSS